MSDIATKLTTIAENQQKVYDAGKQAEYDAFWDAYQIGGVKQNYSNRFSGFGWYSDTFKPKYDIIASNAQQMFMRAYNLSGDLEQMLKDLGVKLDLSQCSDVTQMFGSATKITCIPELDLREVTRTAGTMYQTFVGCTNLVTIRKIILKDDGSAKFTTSDFTGCSALENLVIEGVIGNNNFSVSSCPNLTHDSLMSIINALADYSDDTSGTTWKVTIGSTNIAKLTDDELSIAYNKGWTVV